MAVEAEGSEGRHLTPSTLYQEDAFENGHSSVWGSLYVKETGKWGFACCQVMDRKEQCTKPSRSKRKAEGGSESEGTSEDSEEGSRVPAPVRWSSAAPPPEDFKPREDFKDQENFVGHFIRFTMGQWQLLIEGKRTLSEEQEHQDEMVRRMFRSEEALHQTQDALAPLLQRCEDPKLLQEWRKRDKVEAEQLAQTMAQSGGRKLRNSSCGRGDDTAPEMSLMDRLVHMAQHAHEREYAEANKHYIELTLGKKKWHNAYHGGEGKSNKGFKLHTVSMSAPNAFDVDETVNNYIRAFRRVLLFCQTIRPNENVAKHM